MIHNLVERYHNEGRRIAYIGDPAECKKVIGRDVSFSSINSCLERIERCSESSVVLFVEHPLREDEKQEHLLRNSNVVHEVVFLASDDSAKSVFQILGVIQSSALVVKELAIAEEGLFKIIVETVRYDKVSIGFLLRAANERVLERDLGRASFKAKNSSQGSIGGDSVTDVGSSSVDSALSFQRCCECCLYDSYYLALSTVEHSRFSAIEKSVLSELNDLRVGGDNCFAEQEYFLISELQEARDASEHLRSELERERKERDEKSNENASLRRKLINADLEIKYLKESNNQLRSSFSFKFGKLFAEGARSPTAALLIPVNVVKFIVSRVFKKLKLKIRKRLSGKKLNGRQKGNRCKIKAWFSSEESNEIKKNTLPFCAQRNLTSADQELLVTYLGIQIPKKPWAGFVGSKEMYNKANYEGDLKFLFPNTWRHQVEGFAPQEVIIESSLLEYPGGAWAHAFGGCAYGYPSHLFELINLSKEHNIPTILYDITSLSSVRVLSDVIPFCDQVVVRESAKYRYLIDNEIVSRQRCICMEMHDFNPSLTFQ